MPPHSRKSPTNFRYKTEEGLTAQFAETHQLDSGPTEPAKNIQGDESPNQAVWVRNLDRLIKVLPEDTSDFHWIDVGCGSGIALIYIAKKWPFASISGIEHDPRIATVAVENVRRAGLDREGVSIKLGDAAVAKIRRQKNLLFLFNPFGADTFRKMMASNHQTIPGTGSYLLLANDHLLEPALEYGLLVKRIARYNLSVLKLH